MGRRKYLPLLLGGLAVCAATVAPPAQSGSLPLQPAALAQQGPLAERLNAPMTFRLGRRAGSPGCGVDCAEFIYAEGSIRTDSGAKYTAATARLKGRDVPVFIFSPGGQMGGGLALGRAVRRNGAAMIVAQMTPADCGSGSEICTAADKLAGVTVFKPELDRAFCNSACSYALAGGKTRHLVAGSSIGVHQFFQAEKVDAKPDPSAKYSYQHLQQVQNLAGAIVTYLIDMDVSPKLFTAAATVPSTTIKQLSWAELDAMRLVPLSAHTYTLASVKSARPATSALRNERFGAWTLTSNGKDSALSGETVRSAPNGGAVTTRIALGCPATAGRQTLRVEEFRKSNGARMEPSMVLLGTGEARFATLLPATDPQATADRTILDAAAKAGELQVRLVYSAAIIRGGIDARANTALPAKALGEALAALDKACGMAATAVVASPERNAAPASLPIQNKEAHPAEPPGDRAWQLHTIKGGATLLMRFPARSSAYGDVEHSIWLTCGIGEKTALITYQIHGSPHAQTEHRLIRLFGQHVKFGSLGNTMIRIPLDALNAVREVEKGQLEFFENGTASAYEAFDVPMTGFMFGRKLLLDKC